MYGLVLEGGGAKGSYQAGAYKAIKESGIEISAVVGTSIGALNGAMVVQDDFEMCLELWNDIQYSDIIRENDQDLNRLLHSRPDRQTVRIMADRLYGVVSNRGLDITPFRDMIKRYVDEYKIRNSPIDFGIVTYNFTDRKPMELFKEDIPKGEMWEYILASAYVPFFRIEKIGGKTLLDGWFHDNLPYHMLMEKGYENLLILRTHPMEEGELDEISHINSMIVSPREFLGRTFDLDEARIKRNLKLGYFDALKAINNYVGIRYYILPEGEDFYFEYLRNLNEDRKQSLTKLLGIDALPGLSTLFGQVIPKLASILELGRNYNYETIVLGLLEIILDAGNVERFNLYTFSELLNLINSKKESYTHRDHNGHDSIITRFGRLGPFNKEEILLEAAKILFIE